MNARTPDAHRRTYVTLGALVAAIVSGVLPRVASAQQVTGSIGVALTVLPPVAPQSVRITSLRIGRDGMATLRATVQTTSGASELVMTRLSSSADGLVSVRQLPVVARRPSATDLAAREVDYRIDVERAADGAAPRDVQLRLEYLVVAGT